ncbi:MAG: conjugal transfer protein TrbL family protein [Clostridiales bacterium]
MLKQILLLNSSIKEEWDTVITNAFEDVFNMVIGDSNTISAKSLSDIFEATIWRFFTNLGSNLLDESINIINTFIIKSTSIDNLKSYILDYSNLLSFFQIISGTLLIFLIVSEAVERQASGLVSNKERTVVLLVGRSILSAAFIYILPKTIIEILLNLNKLIIEGIINENEFNSNLKSDLFSNVDEFSIVVTIAFFILSIAFFILAILGIIRYLEIIISILLAPICAAFFVKSNEKLSIWLREITAVIFTQSIYILLLSVMVKVFSNNNLSEISPTNVFVKYIVSIGIIFVMLKGPNLLRKFLYNTGNYSITFNHIGYMGKISAYKYIISKGIK